MRKTPSQQMNVSAAQHTPGPWNVKRPSFGRGIFVAPAHANSVRLSVAKVLADDPEVEEADALLIAAAPELLAACVAYMADRAEAGCTSDSKAVKGMRAAIAKATGIAA